MSSGAQSVGKALGILTFEIFKLVTGIFILSGTLWVATFIISHAWRAAA